MRMSRPVPPSIVSLPLPPSWRSLPARPSIRSLPPRPRMRWLFAVPGRKLSFSFPVDECHDFSPNCQAARHGEMPRGIQFVCWASPVCLSQLHASLTTSSRIQAQHKTEFRAVSATTATLPGPNSLRWLQSLIQCAPLICSRQQNVTV